MTYNPEEVLGTIRKTIFCKLYFTLYYTYCHIRRLTGSKPNTVLHPLTCHDKTYNTPTEISNVLAATYS